MEYRIVYDPTVFVRESISAVVETLVEALLLVVLVVVLFLRTWRASIIPLAAVPVSLVGTLAVMHLLGFSLNALSLFGLVLAIGIVVDDAIVVVENVERNIARGLAPIDAAKQAMSEVTSPIIAISAVLIAVFVPTAFISGLSGQFYEQFALTIAICTVISAVNSLTLSPALAALLLKPHGAPPDRFQRGIDFAFGWVLGPFNRFFEWLSVRYVGLTGKTLKRAGAAAVVYVGLVGVTWLGFASVPQGFIPQQDKEYLVAFAQLPEAATLDRTEDVIRRMTDIMLAEPGVAHSVAFPGLSVNGFVNAPNVGIAFVALRDFEDPNFEKTRSANEIAASLNQKFAADPGRVHRDLPAAADPGLGHDRRLQAADRGPRGSRASSAVRGDAEDRRRRLADAGPHGPVLELSGQRAAGARRRRSRQGDGAGRAARPRSSRRCRSISARCTSTTSTASAARIRSTRRPTCRSALEPEDIGQLKVRNAHGDMVPLGSFVSLEQTAGPDRVMHYNGYPSAEINGGPAPGYSSGRSRGADRGARGSVAAERHGGRVDRAHVSEAARRQHGALDLPAVRAARVPRARGALREPHAAAGRDPDRADDVALRDRGRLARRRRQQHLHADRSHRARRPRGEERDPDRRVRAQSRAGRARARGTRSSTPRGCGCGRS